MVKREVHFTQSPMTRDAALAQTRTPAPSGLRLGERLRQLRVAAALTQSDLAGEPYATIRSVKDEAKSHAIRVCG